MSSVSPFIRPIQTQGGTFYTFSSAAEDLGFTFNNDGSKFAFSKYALLNIPDIKRPTQGALLHENFIQLDTIPGAFEYVNGTKTQNMQFAESFENYVLNLETMLTNFETYDPKLTRTVSERVFFKWLKEIGAIRFRKATTNESTLAAGLRFTEEDSSNIYDRLVQYIGQIDVVNSVKSNADAYSELYVHVPTKDGATPLILFSSLQDVNYFPGQNLVNSPLDPLNTTYLFGRSYTQVNPGGLDTHAYFDSSSGSLGASSGLTAGSAPVINTPGEYQLFTYIPSTSLYTVGWWFSYPEANSYWTQPAALSGTFDDPSNDSLMIRGVKAEAVISQDVVFQRSRLDGISLDFNIDNYLPISSNPALKSFSDFNSLPESPSFDFNAVLVYYDVYDVATPENTTTNLFGVLFLDDVEDTLAGGGEIKRLKKYKPNRITGLNGNSYGFKINLKFDINTETAAIVTAINEYAPFSMQIFIEALNKLQSAADTLTSQSAEISALSTSVDQLKELVYNGTDFQELTDQVAAIQTELENASLLLENADTLNELISRNYQEILNLYNNKTSVQVVYNTDVLQEGDGITLEKTAGGTIKISNTEQQYNLSDSPVMNIITDFTSTPSAWIKTVTLRPYSNYLKISNGTAMNFDKDVNVYVDDSDFRWSNGQSFKVVVDHFYAMDMYTQGSFDFVVYTDGKDRLNSGEIFSKEIARISSTDFYAKNGVPQIEIVCLNYEDYEFTFDLN